MLLTLIVCAAAGSAKGQNAGLNVFYPQSPDPFAYYSCSDDGSTLFGGYSTTSSDSYWGVVCRAGSQDWAQLGPHVHGSMVRGVSADGSVAAGRIFDDQVGRWEAAIWTPLGGTVAINSSSWSYADATAVSRNGQYIAGTYDSTHCFVVDVTGAVVVPAFEFNWIPVWVSDDGLAMVARNTSWRDLIRRGANGEESVLPDVSFSGIAGDGTVAGSVLRTVDGAEKLLGYVWTRDSLTLLTGLDESPEGVTQAIDTANGGHTVLGLTSGPNVRAYWLWTPQEGTLPLAGVLADIGVSLDGFFTPPGFINLSDDGRRLSGFGTDLEGRQTYFVITLPPLCRADVGLAGGEPGRDGRLNEQDFVAFISLFFAGDARADMGSTGGVAQPDGHYDNNDFIVFINAFFDGCQP